MKTRVIHTDIYEKLVKWNAPKEVRVLYPYLITNKRINICGTYELPDQYINFETLLSVEEVALAKKWLTEHKKAFFFNGWVHIPNVDEYNNYKNSPKNITAYEKEVNRIPTDIKVEFGILPDTSIIPSNTSIDSDPIVTRNKKSEIENKKPKERVVKGEETDPMIEYFQNPPQEDIDELNTKYAATKTQIKDKAEDMYYWWLKLSAKKRKEYSSAKAILRNAVKGDFGKRKPPEVFISPVDESFVPASPEKVAEVRKKRDELAGKMSVN